MTLSATKTGSHRQATGHSRGNTQRSGWDTGGTPLAPCCNVGRNRDAARLVQSENSKLPTLVSRLAGRRWSATYSWRRQCHWAARWGSLAASRRSACWPPQRRHTQADPPYRGSRSFRSCRAVVDEISPRLAEEDSIQAGVGGVVRIHLNRRQVGAVGKGRPPDAGDAGRDRDSVQPGAAVEREVTDVGNAVWLWSRWSCRCWLRTRCPRWTLPAGPRSRSGWSPSRPVPST